MFTLLRTTWIIFTTHVGRTFVSGRALACAGLALLPLLACFIISQFIDEHGAPPRKAALLMGWMMLVQVLVPLVSLLLGSAAVSEEVEDRTLTYLVTRPFPRPAVLLGRWLAALVFVLALLGLSGFAVSNWLLAMSEVREAELELPPDFTQRIVLTILIGGTVYSALFAAAGAFLKRPVLMGLAYTFVVEGIAANAPLGTQKMTLQYYLKSFLLGERQDLLDELGPRFLRVELLEPAAALQTLGLIFGITLLAASWWMSRKQFLLND